MKTLESQYNYGINSRDRYILYQPGAHNEFESRRNQAERLLSTYKS